MINMKADSTRDTTAKRRQQQDAVKVHAQNYPPVGSGHNLQFQSGEGYTGAPFQVNGTYSPCRPGTHHFQRNRRAKTFEFT